MLCLFRFIRRQQVPTLIVWDDARRRRDMRNIRIQTDAVEFKQPAEPDAGLRTPFRIPSTDMLETEEWINQIQVEPPAVLASIARLEPYQDRYIHKYTCRPKCHRTWIDKTRIRGRKRNQPSASARQLSILVEALAEAIPEPIVICQKKRRGYLAHIRTKLSGYYKKRVSFSDEIGARNLEMTTTETFPVPIER